MNKNNEPYETILKGVEIYIRTIYSNSETFWLLELTTIFFWA